MIATATGSSMSSSPTSSVTPARLRVMPGPPGVPLFGNTLDMWADQLRMCQTTHRDYGDFAMLRFGPLRMVLVNDADAVHHVLTRNHKNYKKSRNYQGLKLFLGEGLLTSEGEFWRRQRKLAAPAFHHQALVGFAEQMAESTELMLERWQALHDAAESESPVLDVHAEMMRLTFRIVGQTLFSTDVEGEAQAIGDALAFALDHADHYVSSVVRLPPWVPTPRNTRFRQARRTLDELVFRIVDDRRKALAEGRPVPNDLLGMLMRATDDADGRMTNQQLRDEVMTLVLAGHETTANALSWTLYLLSKHPDVERRLVREVREVLDGRAPTFADMPRLAYAERVIQESMRLYPPAWAFEREAVAADQLGGYGIEPGTMVAIVPFTMHRNTKYWSNPEGFDPDRFAPEHADSRPKCAYIPFGDGARVCIGRSFAMMEAKIILAMLVQRFTLPLVSGHPIEMDARITLRPKHGIKVRLERQTL